MIILLTMPSIFPSTPIAIIFFLLYILSNTKKAITLNIILLFSSSIAIAFVNQSVVIFSLFLTSCLFFRRSKTSWLYDSNFFNISARISVIIVAIQMFINYKPIMFGYEQNFTALFVFYLLLINKGWWKLFSVLLGLWTLSRGFLISLIVYYLFSTRLRYIKYFTSLRVWQLFVFLVPSAFFLLFFIYPYIEVTDYDISPLRLFNFIDISAISRFKLLEPVLASFSRYWLTGLPVEIYTDSFLGGTKMVHNVYAQMCILYGVPFTAFFLTILASLFSSNRELRAVFIALFVWGFSLHGVFSGQLLFIIFMLNNHLVVENN